MHGVYVPDWTLGCDFFVEEGESGRGPVRVRRAPPNRHTTCSLSFRAAAAAEKRWKPTGDMTLMQVEMLKSLCRLA